jgi:hypothetical protein
MAFDYGSINLGLQNPFKKEGVITAIRGLLLSLLGIYLLIEAVLQVKSDVLSGWILVVFGMFLLSIGIKALSLGIFATLRYFVGRNPPTSLARNFSKSETGDSQQEANYVAYQVNELEEMLVGRKNGTFVEPIGLLARLLHSLFPRLLFMPYPIRNMAQGIFGAWVKTLTAILAYGLIAVVCLFGFAGALGERMFPIYSVLLVLFLAVTWWGAGRSISRAPEHKVESLGGGSLVKVIGGSILIPVLLAMGASILFGSEANAIKVIETWQALLPEWHSTGYVIGILITASLSCLLLIMLLRARIASVNPVAEVSELRENWQETVHPNEIFINLDNLVMANRRYKEVPNRVYRELDPKLQEQVDNKGEFKGELIQEVQPKVKNLDLGGVFNLARDLSLIWGNLIYLAGGILIFFMTYGVIDVAQFAISLSDSSLRSILSSEQAGAFLDLLASALHLLFIGMLCNIFARILTNAAHQFYAEIQFESLLVYFKCEGTFSESKISTGTGIYDSTRSENILVRSSITPWIIASRLVTTTFAATGMRNLEYPRYVLEMHKAEDELMSIKDDVVGFLKDRESIAAITSQRDLGNACQLHQLNQQTRAMPAKHQSLPQDAEAAGYLMQEGEREEKREDARND